MYDDVTYMYDDVTRSDIHAKTNDGMMM